MSFLQVKAAVTHELETERRIFPVKRYIGISLNDDYADLSVNGETYTVSVPTVVCKEKGSEQWLIGEAAYESTLKGSGIIVDKLMSLLKKHGTATIEKHRYKASDLMTEFLKRLILEGLYGLRCQEARASQAYTETATDADAAESETSRQGTEADPNAAETAEPVVPAEKKPEEKPEIKADPETAPAFMERPASIPIDELLKEIGVICVSIRKPEEEMISELRKALLRVGIPDEKIHILSHTESFVRFVLKQDKNLYNRMVGLFELSNQCFYYYEMQVSRGSRKYIVADSEAEEEAFRLDILKTEAGQKIGDKILRSCAERIMERKSYASVFLAGKGFESTEFAPDFMSYICSRRRVCIEARLFALGAEYYAEDIDNGVTDEYMILCDTRVSSDVDVKVIAQEKERRLPIVSAGSSWLEAKSCCHMILDQQNYIDFQVTPLVGYRKPVQLRMMLDGFPERENRTTRIKMSTEFLDADRLKITVRDEGFGTLFPATDTEISEEINLRETLERN